LALVLALGAGLALAGLTDATLVPGLVLIAIGTAMVVPALDRLTP
jgi:hypothetical protein